MKKPQPASRILITSASSRARVLRGRFLLVVVSVFLLILGFTTHSEAAPANLPAILLTTGGCVGLVWYGIRTMRDWHHQIQSEANASHRHARKQARYQRVAEQKGAREFERKQIAARVAVSMELRDRERREQVQQDECKAQLRSIRENALLLEAERIASIPESEMNLELIRIWELRGWQLLQKQHIPEGEGTLCAEELLMMDGSGEREIILFLTDRNKAGVSEIEMAERQRIEMSAHNACLLSRNGFTPQAVRLAQRFPLTLAEPHLLALWSLTSVSKAAERESFQAD